MSVRSALSIVLLPTLFSLPALSAGCSEEADGAPAKLDTGVGGSGGGGGASSGAGDSIAWGACPEDFSNECATVPLPLDHAKPDGETLPIFVSRYLAQGGAAKAQVWLLQGGPGGSGNVFKGIIEQLFAPVMPDVDLYVLEHRGVGESSRLGCPVQEAPASAEGVTVTADEWPACIDAVKAQWGEKLSHFTTTADAEDLASLIERTHEPDKKVFVWGGSYGTTRAIRFLQTHPDMVDGVILDSVDSPGVQLISEYDTQFDPVAREIAALCAADEVCGAKLGPDPWNKITRLIAKLDAGECSALGMNGQILRQLFPLFLKERTLRAHLFPLVYRLDRCDAADVTVVDHYITTLLTALQGNGPAKADRDSVVLQWHVALSEMWEEPPPSATELQQRCASQLFCGGEALGAGPITELWPRYPHDQYVNQWPTSKTPILAMNGTLDPQTPIEKARFAADKLTAPHQTFVTVPFSSHIVALNSPVKTANAPPCGTQMLASFVADPTAAPDTSCLNDLVPVAFTEDPAVVQQVFGTADLWENTESLAAPKSRPIDWARVAAVLRERARF